MPETSDRKTIAQELGEFIISHDYEVLPQETVDKVKQYIIDVIGCTVAASKEPQTKALVEVIQAEGGKAHSSVFGCGFKTSVMNAALINGTAGHIFDYDDDHREGTLHPSVAVFPAVFALGEKNKVSGKEFLRALILGLEVMIRVGESFLGKTYYQGFHPTGTCGVFGSAAGCSALLGHNKKQITYALGLAGSFSAGVTEYKTEGSWSKPLQAGHPAMSGVLAAFLAEKNFIGGSTIFEGPNGVVRAFSFKDQYDCGRITEGLGQKWEMIDTSIKAHACCRFSAPVVDCGLELYRQGARANNVEKIIAKVCDHSVRVLCNPIERKIRPQTHVDAQFSLPYAAAVSIGKNHAGIEEFKKESFENQEIITLAEKVTWEVDPEAEKKYPKAYPATLIAILTDGRQLSAHVDFPKGDPENPISMEEIEDKFHLLTGRYIESNKRKAILEEVQKLEDISDISQLSKLIG